MDSIGVSGDTIWQTFKVTNDGNYSDSYSLIATISSWPTTIWNSAGTSQITSVGPIGPGQSVSAKIRIIIPVAAAFGATDSLRLTIRSQHNAALVNTIRCQTLTEGPAAAIPYVDSFDSPMLSASKWITNIYAVVDTLAVNPPTGGMSLHLDGDPYGGDTLMSQVIDASSSSALNLYYAVEQGGKLDEPEADEDLELQYYSSANKWTLLRRHLGAEPASGSFGYVSIPLPANAMHRRLRIRFISTCQANERDNWFIDDFGIKTSSQISQSVIGSLSPTLSPPQQATTSWRIQNTGAAPLTYNLEIIPDERPTKSQSSAIAATAPEARGPDPIIVKGGEEPPAGPFRNIYSGGPDSGGYYWSSSNDSPGPGYSWMDISASGTVIAGLLDDNVVGPFPIGFAFPFYESLHTEFYVSSNGLVGFADSEGLDSPIKHSIPNLLPPNNFIALLWDDLIFSDPLNPNSRVYYQSDGSRLVIQYSSVGEYGGNAGDVFTGEVILHADGTIILQYQSFASGFDRAHCTVGIEGPGGLTGLQVVFMAYFLQNQMAIRFSNRQADWLTVAPMNGVVPSGTTNNVTLTFSSQDISPGYYSAQLKLRCSDPDLFDSLIVKNVSLNVNLPFTIGDSNGDGLVNIGDIFTIISCVFGPGQVPQPAARADVDCSGRLTVSDAVYLIMYIFAGGPSPCIAQQGGSL